MLIDASTLESHAVLDGEVCVIGAGPAGLALVSALAERGVDVVLLESGDTGEDSRAQALNRGENAGYPYFRLDRARARGVGGSSRWWYPAGPERWPVNGGMRSRPLDPSDYSSPDGPAWPFGAEELAPHYERAHALLDLGPVDYAAGPWAAATGTHVPQGTGIEGTLCRFADAGCFTRLADTVSSAPSVRVITGATVLRLDTHADGRSCSAVRVAAGPGREFEVRAARVVLAGGGIENARLLLLSDAAHPGGMGNHSGHLGRWFMEHPHVEAAYLAPAEGRGTEALRFFARTEHDGRAAIGALRVSDVERANRRLTNTTVGLIPRHAGRTTLAARSVAELAWGIGERSLPLPWERHLARAVRRPGDLVRALRTFAPGTPEPNHFAMVLTAEQTPNPRSRVSLGQRRDRFGQPVARLEWRLAGRDLASLRGTVGLVGDALERAGYGRTESLVARSWGFPRVHGCWHAIGTTRMSADPGGGVVDADGRIHTMDNVYVAGSSVFPTAGATTVTLTIAAMALRLAAHLGGDS